MSPGRGWPFRVSLSGRADPGCHTGLPLGVDTTSCGYGGDALSFEWMDPVKSWMGLGGAWANQGIRGGLGTPASLWHRERGRVPPPQSRQHRFCLRQFSARRQTNSMRHLESHTAGEKDAHGHRDTDTLSRYPPRER
ncbi:hypothetical protein J6590_102233 [Homalodisca vitripennis]|nr:hypothetical protein J6590_102233 [Homalodisca vitripennis]